MGSKFFRIDNKQTLDSLLSDSRTRPVIVFKHSNACGVSASAYRELEKLDNQVNMVEVQTAREVSRDLADLTGVQHETPQVIVLRDGKAVWNASHFQIKAAEVIKAVESHS
jgi:monothiol bacilliredoxin